MSSEGLVEGGDEDLRFANRVASECHRQYAALPKTGKPNTAREWTALAGVVRGTHHSRVLGTVALGTGSKCLGAKAMSPAGDVLNDSHAEVMARRAFLRYLYHEAERFHATGTSEVFGGAERGRCALREDVAFHFYTSRVPCGDAAIFPKVGGETDDYGECLPGLDPENTSDSDSICKRDDNLVGNERVVLTKPNDGDSETLLECKSVPGDENTSVCGSISKREDGSIRNGRVALTKSNGGDSETLLECKSVRGEENTSVCGLIFKQDDGNEREVSTKPNVGSSETSVGEETGGTGTKRRRETDGTEPAGCRVSVATPSKRSKTSIKARTSADIHRTGAKCVPSSGKQDPRSPGVGYHVVGVLRTKPGRGDPTLSLSCSDKLARWNAVGCQGALLSLLVEPVRFRSLVVGGGCPFSRDSLARAVVGRTSPLRLDEPLIVQSTVVFVDGRRDDGTRQPCASSIAWARVPDRPAEVAVRGRRQGATRGASGTGLLVCKRELARRFVSVFSSLSVATQDLGRAPYARLKAMAGPYRDEWRSTRALCFPSWPDKPASLLEFTLDG